MGSNPRATSASKTASRLPTTQSTNQQPSVSGVKGESGPSLSDLPTYTGTASTASESSSSSSSSSHQTSRKLFSHKEKQRLIKDCEFSLRTGRYDNICERPIERNQRVIVEDYSDVIKDSDCMDKRTGRFKTPVQGRFRFGGELRIWAIGEVSLFVCGSDGRREKVHTVSVRRGKGRGGSDGSENIVEWDCPAGMNVWLEVKGVRVLKYGKFSAWFYGSLL